MQNALPSINERIQGHLAEIFVLWDELSTLKASQSDAARKLCMERLCAWLNAQDAFWVAIVHMLRKAGEDRADPMCGWRIRVIEPLHWCYHDSNHIRRPVRQTNGGMHPGATNIALAAGVGLFRAYTLQSGDLVDLESFEKTQHYDFYYRQRAIRDRIWVIFPVTADAESVFCFDRIGEQEHFTRSDLDLAAFVLRGIKWFHYRLLLSHGIGLCAEPLTPAERRVLPLLITGASERAIADELRFSQGTLHQYATRVYRKFGVHGRTEFTAMWLDGAG